MSPKRMNILEIGKTKLSTAIFFRVRQKTSGELWSTYHSVYAANVYLPTPPQKTSLGRPYFGFQEVVRPLIFARARE